MQMFDGAEVSAELDARLRAAGLNPDDSYFHRRGPLGDHETDCSMEAFDCCGLQCTELA